MVASIPEVFAAVAIASSSRMAVTTAAQSGGEYRCTSLAVTIASTSHMPVTIASQSGGDYRFP